ncbi:MAG: gliding motility-associated C-terminal domain-containing protein [Flavobacteriales bacterium]
MKKLQKPMLNYFLLTLMFFTTSFVSFSQGLFSNGEFENFTSCPTALSQGSNVVGVTNCTVTTDYFNTCGLNANSCGKVVPLLPANGNGCLGMFCQPWSSTSTNYETAVLSLDNPTVNGTQYNISFSLYNFDQNFNSCTASGLPNDCFSFGLYFFKSSNPPACPPGPFFPMGSQPAPDVFINASQTAPLNTWQTFNLVYNADDNYDKVLFGWFPNPLAYNTAACPNNKVEYVYIDNLCIDVPGGNCAINPCDYSVNAGLNAIICANDSITLSATAGGGVISTTWTSSGDGTFDNPSLLNATYLPGISDISAGTVTLTITTDDPAGSCNAETSDIILTITNNANSTITAVGPFCENDVTINFSAVDAGGVWSGNGITNSSLGTFSPSVAGVGTWPITYTISGQCGDFDTISITVNSADTALFNYPQSTYCIVDQNPSPNVLATTGGSFSINNGGAIDVNTGVIDLSTSGIGNFIVTYFTSGLCPDTSTFNISISSTLNASINTVSTFCENDATINLSATDAGGVWSGSGITDTSLGTFNPSVAGVGTWPIIYTISGQCGDADTIFITVNSVDTALFNYPQSTYCIVDQNPSPNVLATVGGSFSINNSGVIDVNTGIVDLASSGIGNFIIMYLTSGLCPDSSTFNITISAASDASINPVFPFCENDAVINLSTTDAGGVWSGNGITNSSLGTFSPSVAGVGTWPIIYTISGQCGDADTTSIVVESTVDATIIPAGPFCSNDSPVNLVAQNSGGIWSGIGITDTALGIFNPSEADSGIWNIIYTISGVCNDIGNTAITVIKTDDVQINFSESSYCIPNSLNPTPEITGTTGGFFSIDNGGIIDENTGTIDLHSSGIGNYVVTYSTSNISSCPDLSSVTVEICGETTIIIPNVFTPNSDNSNDVFKIMGENLLSVNTQIYNRWGQLIFSWNTLDGFWDGKTTSGTNASEGTYYYIIKINDLNNIEIEKTGTVTLLR